MATYNLRGHPMLTVHDLAADDSNWPEHAIGFRVRGGRAVWESATYREDQPMERGVWVGRLIPTDGRGIIVRTRYVRSDTPITFIFPRER